MPTLFEPLTLGAITMPNRIVMAPMTRSRHYQGGVPSPLAPTYYAQRASAGLIIAEATRPSAIGQGYVATPGIHTDAQVAGWRKVTTAVRNAGGRMFLQIMHAGRIGYPDLLPDGLHPVAPSPVRAAGLTFTADGSKENVVPKELTVAGIATTIEDFASAAGRAIDGGFDGVEVHGAYGYLVQQFLSSNANQRLDGYGDSIVNRTRFATELVSAVAERVGPERVGLRISPGTPNGPLNDIVEEDSSRLYTVLLSALNPIGLAYLHLVETHDPTLNEAVRAAWHGRLIVNPKGQGGDPANRADGERALTAGADAVSFARAYLANPDLPRRFEQGAELNVADGAVFYGGDHRGYTDWPTLTDKGDTAQG